MIEVRSKTQEVIRFNWDAIKEHTGNDVQKIIDFFVNMYVTKAENFVALNPYALQILADRRTKGSFIQNVKSLAENSSNATDSEIFVYLDLISKRNYFTFVNSKNKVNYLPTWRVKDSYDVDKLIKNRLLLIEDNNIHFIYENGDE